MKRSVLIADDASFMRMLIKDILTDTDYEVIGEAETGKEAVKLYQQLLPDVVTMDITMPNMDGITAIKKILTVDKSANIVVCSAVDQQSVIKEAIQAGAKDFIPKPLHRDRVIKTINNILD
ncbi:MAG: response regulator [Bacillota bacterium]